MPLNIRNKMYLPLRKKLSFVKTCPLKFFLSIGKLIQNSIKEIEKGPKNSTQVFENDVVPTPSIEIQNTFVTLTNVCLYR